MTINATNNSLLNILIDNLDDYTPEEELEDIYRDSDYKSLYDEVKYTFKIFNIVKFSLDTIFNLIILILSAWIVMIIIKNKFQRNFSIKLLIFISIECLWKLKSQLVWILHILDIISPNRSIIFAFDFAKIFLNYSSVAFGVDVMISLVSKVSTSELWTKLNSTKWSFLIFGLVSFVPSVLLICIVDKSHKFTIVYDFEVRIPLLIISSVLIYLIYTRCKRFTYHLTSEEICEVKFILLMQILVVIILIYVQFEMMGIYLSENFIFGLCLNIMDSFVYSLRIIILFSFYILIFEYDLFTGSWIFPSLNNPSIARLSSLRENETTTSVRYDTEMDILVLSE